MRECVLEGCVGSVAADTLRRIGIVGVSLLAAGCYLFSDEPKARKTEREPAVAEDADAEANVDEADGPAPSEPLAIEDGCPAELSGVETSARTIDSDCGPVVVRGGYRIDGGRLTLAAGARLQFEAGASLAVGRGQPGVLTVSGTSDAPVRLEGLDGATWAGLSLHAGAEGSSLRHVAIAGAERAIALEGEGIEITNVAISGAVGEPVSATPTAAASLLDLTLEPHARIVVSGGTVRGVIEWPANRYRLTGVVRIEGDATPGASAAQLSLAPGTTLLADAGVRIDVGALGPGALVASAVTGLPADAPVGAVVPDGTIALRGVDERPGAWAGVRVGAHGHLSLRGVELAHGGDRNEGIIVAEGEATVALEGCEVHDSLVGVELRGSAVTVESFADNRFAAVPVAVRTTPTSFAGLGDGNHYDEAAVLEIARGKIEADARWRRQDARVIVLGDVYVDGGATLTVAPGSSLGFASGAVFGVGYYARGSLDLRATQAEPIVLGPAQPGEAWTGLVLGTHAREVRLEHVQLRQTDGAAGVELRDGAEATLVDVRCEDCANAVVRWGCASKVGNIGLVAAGGTPRQLQPPTGCR